MFDFDDLPKEILEKCWKRYHPYLLIINRYHPLMFGEVQRHHSIEPQLKYVSDLLISTFPIDPYQIIIKDNSIAILVADNDDNIDIIDESMKKLGLKRTTISSQGVHIDGQNHQWRTIQYISK